jgi:DNA recombination protein RmuC
MDFLPIILGAIIFLLVLAVIYLVYLLSQPKTIQVPQENNLNLENNLNQALKNQEELLKVRLENLSKEIQASSVTLAQINTVLLAPLQRGRLGNTQLDQLLSLYLPKNDQVYQLEYRLKKPTGKGGFLIVDAIIFGIDQKNNIAIDSKFPLENYLLLHKENLSELEKKEIEKNFKNNLKDHIKKVAEYVSSEDNTEHAVMFIPSEAVFAKINEHSFYEILEFALEKKVSLCSPVTLAIIINQIL